MAVRAAGARGEARARTAADLNGFRFESIRTNDDPMMLPGVLQYGGMAAFASLCAPAELLLHNHQGTDTGQWAQAAYRSAGAETRLKREEERLEAEKVVEWLLTGSK